MGPLSSSKLIYVEYSFTLLEDINVIGLIKKLNSQELSRVLGAEKMLRREESQGDTRTQRKQHGQYKVKVIKP